MLPKRSDRTAPTQPSSSIPPHSNPPSFRTHKSEAFSMLAPIGKDGGTTRNSTSKIKDYRRAEEGKSSSDDGDGGGVLTGRLRGMALNSKSGVVSNKKKKKESAAVGQKMSVKKGETAPLRRTIVRKLGGEQSALTESEIRERRLARFNTKEDENEEGSESEDQEVDESSDSEEAQENLIITGYKIKTSNQDSASPTCSPLPQEEAEEEAKESEQQHKIDVAINEETDDDERYAAFLSIIESLQQNASSSSSLYEDYSETSTSTLTESAKRIMIKTIHKILTDLISIVEKGKTESMKLRSSNVEFNGKVGRFAEGRKLIWLFGFEVVDSRIGRVRDFDNGDGDSEDGFGKSGFSRFEGNVFRERENSEDGVADGVVTFVYTGGNGNGISFLRGAKDAIEEVID